MRSFVAQLTTRVEAAPWTFLVREPPGRSTPGATVVVDHGYRLLYPLYVLPQPRNDDLRRGEEWTFHG
jgi:hypothetical protein